MQAVGRYEILGELGRGAMGVVYRAQDPVIGRTVAIKTIRLSDFTDPEELQRLKQRLFREARSAGILSHPNIVTIYDIGQEGETAYIAMEFVAGDTLEHVMRVQGVLGKDVIVSVLSETAAALDYAHQKGIVHRDIKPANIMLNENGAAKITDFGVAKILSQQITQADTVLGTPSYMSPEQIEAKGIDGKTDQFALAVISYQLLTGEKPFTGDTLPSLLFKIVREDAPESHRLNSTLCPDVDAVLRKAMAKPSGNRYGTCADFVRALVEGLAACPGWAPQRRGSVSSMPTLAPAVNTDDNATVTVLAPSSTLSGKTQATAPPEATDEEETVLQSTASTGSILAAPVVEPPPPAPVEPAAQTISKAAPVEQPPPPPPAKPEPKPVAAAPPPAPAPAPVEAPAPAVAPRRRAEEDEQEVAKSGSGRTVAMVLAGVVLAVGGFFGYSYFGGQKQAPAPETEQTASTATPPAEPAATTPAPKPAAPAPPPEAKAAPAPVTTAAATKAPVETKAAAPKPGAGPIPVSLVSDPPGARVTFGEQPVDPCTTPCAIELPAARYVITAQLDGYRSAVRILSVPQDTEATIRMEQLAGQLMVRSTPDGAQVLIDGKAQTQRTPAMVKVPAGKHKLIVRRDGVPDYTEDIDIKDQVISTITVDWGK